MADAPVVFIPYSHDTPGHKQWVGELATRLRKGGVDVILDQWDLRLGDDITLFMERGVTGSDRVLVVCTDEYVRKAEAGQGGVGYERMIVTGELVRNIGTTKFVPIVRQSTTETPVPSFLMTRLRIDFRDDGTFEQMLETLLREIHEAPKTAKPPLGDNPYAKREPTRPSTLALPADIRNLTTLYNTMFELARQDDLLGWRQIIKPLRPFIDTSLSEWRNRNNNRQFESAQALYDAVDEAMLSLGPVFLIALTGVESGRPHFKDQRGFMDDLLNASGWIHSGPTAIAELPFTLGYVYHSLHGAMCMSTKQLGMALDFASMKVQKPFDHDPVEIWKRKDLVGWPKSLGGDCRDAWQYIATAMPRWTWLASLFGNEAHFRASLTAYYMALNVLELASFLSLGYGSKLEERQLSLDVPLTFASEAESVRQKAFRLLLDQPSLSELWEKLKVSRADMETHWAAWLKHGHAWVFSVCRLWNADLPHAGLFRHA